MLVSSNQTLNLAQARSIVMSEISGLVSGKIADALQKINEHNITVENRALEAEKVLAELDAEAETETSALAKLMWPTFRLTKVQEIEKIRAEAKPIPSVEELQKFFLDDISARILSSLGLQESVATVRKPRGGDGSFAGIWGSAITHNNKNWLVANYRILPDSVKESAKMTNTDMWALFAQNKDGKWYVAKTFEATSPSGVVLEVIRHSSGNPGLAQTNLAISAWYSNHSESVKKLMSMDSEKMAKALA